MFRGAYLCKRMKMNWKDIHETQNSGWIRIIGDKRSFILLLVLFYNFQISKNKNYN